MRFLAIDCETYDPNLKKLGPGFNREDSLLLTCQIYPNTDEQPFVRLEKILADTEPVTWVGANILYDAGFLNLTGDFIDVCIIERLLDNNAKSVKLDVLAEKYLGKKKTFNEIEEWAELNGIKDPIANMHRVPIELVNKYCLEDAKLAYDVWREQMKIFPEDLKKVLELEMNVLKVLHAMRESAPFIRSKDSVEYWDLVGSLESGIRIAKYTITNQFKQELNIKTDIGKKILQQYCDERNIPYKLTEKRFSPQFNAAFFAANGSDPVVKSIKEIEKLRKLKDDFVESLQEYVCNGRIYATYHSLKSDENGTITGRLSCSKPNLQQIPKRDKVYGPLIRNQFIAPEGYKWIKCDYSQQEVRVLVHFAVENDYSGAVEFARLYKQDKSADAYNIAVSQCHKKGFTSVTRDHAKVIILGLQYGMGKATLAKLLNSTEEEADSLKKIFIQSMPFIRDLDDLCKRQVSNLHMIRTLSGRKTAFDRFVLKTDNKDDPKLYTYSEALESVQGNTNAFKSAFKVHNLHKSLNYLIQGSAADITKQAMVNCYEAGLVTCLTVHDELNFMVPEDEVTESIEIIRDCMENTFELHVPMKVDIEVGLSWK